MSGFKEKHIEPELSYSISEKDLAHIVTALTPYPRHFNINGHHATIASIERRKTIHFFGNGTDGGRKIRLRAWREGREFFGSLDMKGYVNGIKYEKKLFRLSGKKKILNKLKSISPIVGAMVKDRLHIFAWWNSEVDKKAKVKIGIDKIYPIYLGEPSMAGDPYYHLEIEGDGSHSEAAFVQSAMFREHLSDVLTPLRDSEAKWLLAERINEGVLDLAEWDTKSFKRFFEAAMEAAESSKKNLLV